MAVTSPSCGAVTTDLPCCFGAHDVLLQRREFPLHFGLLLCRAQRKLLQLAGDGADLALHPEQAAEQRLSAGRLFEQFVAPLVRRLRTDEALLRELLEARRLRACRRFPRRLRRQFKAQLSRFEFERGASPRQDRLLLFEQAGAPLELFREAGAALVQLLEHGGVRAGALSGRHGHALGPHDEQHVAGPHRLTFLDVPLDHDARLGRGQLQNACRRHRDAVDAGALGVLAERKQGHQRDGNRDGGGAPDRE